MTQSEHTSSSPVKRLALWILGFAAALLLCTEISRIPVSHSVAYLDDNTASWHFYREWPLGIRTGNKTQLSPLAHYVKTHAPKDLEHRWRPQYRTGRSLFGSSVSFSCGLNPPALLLIGNTLGKWIPHHSKDEVLDLYELLRSGDPVAGTKRAEEVRVEAERYR